MGARHRVWVEALNGREALAMVEALRPSVALIDCVLPDMPGVQVAAELRRRNLVTRALAFSAYDQEDLVRAMVEAGAAGYVTKNDSLATVAQAIRAVAAGEAYFSQRVVRHLDSLAEARYSLVGRLAEREGQVLRLIAQGKTNKEIGQVLRMAEGTVESHVSRVLHKLHLRSRTEAALWYRGHSLQMSGPV